MKKIIFFEIFCVFISCLSTLSAEQKKILTPLGNQPENLETIYNDIWDATKIEQCKQAWLFSGGIFKRTDACTFTEMNNYVIEHSTNCMAIIDGNIYIGTDNGIYLSTDYGENWLNPEQDGIDNLIGTVVSAIKAGTNKLFIGTNSGIKVSTNNGNEWISSLNSENIVCIEFGADNDVFIGATNAGIYKSTDYGDTWNVNNILQFPTYCLKFNNGILYAGTTDNTDAGLMKLTDDGWISLWDDDKVTSIYTTESDLFIGTDVEGCLLSTDGGSSFNSVNTGLPKTDLDKYYTLNSIQIFDDQLYVATENGLYVSNLSPISWLSCCVRDWYFQLDRDYEQHPKEIFINDDTDEIWIACSGTKKWASATMITDRDYPLNPENYPNYICHAYAWHIAEGGINGKDMLSPNSMNYIGWGDDKTDWEKQNWDYIKAEWDDPLWDKVTYNWGHSAIKSSKNTGSETEENIIVESKWDWNGPLVEHKILENPYGSSNIRRYWKSRKVVSSEIEVDQRIGREISTLFSDDEITTSIPESLDVEFYVAPMYNHKIHLKSGFHAESGSTFHAYVKDYYSDGGDIKPCVIPWEEEPEINCKKDDVPKISSIDTIRDLPEKVISDNINTNKSAITDDLEFPNNLSFVQSSKDESNILYKFLPCIEYPNQDPYSYSGKGKGTEQDPYQITNIKQYTEMIDDIYGEHYWILMNDIDASETRYWYPKVINGDTVYSGFSRIQGQWQRSLDGRGHVIKNMYVNGKGSQRSQFANVNCFAVKNLGFENCTFENGAFSVFSVHSVEDSGFVIENCFISGTMIGSNSQGSGGWTRGFGFLKNGTIVRNCCSDLTIVSDSAVTNFAMIWDDKSKIENCYAVGRSISPKVLSPFDHYGNVQSCFWDNETIQINDSVGKGIGLPTSEMMKRTTFEAAGWDFDSVWCIDEGKSYPRLRVFGKCDGNEVPEPEVRTLHAVSLQVFPNPATDKITVRYGDDTPPNPLSRGGIEVYDVYGVRVLPTSPLPLSMLGEGGRKVSIDVSGLAAGVYYVKIGAEVRKFVKM